VTLRGPTAIRRKKKGMGAKAAGFRAKKKKKRKFLPGPGVGLNPQNTSKKKGPGVEKSIQERVSGRVKKRPRGKTPQKWGGGGKSRLEKTFWGVSGGSSKDKKKEKGKDEKLRFYALGRPKGEERSLVLNNGEPGWMPS